MSVKSKKYSDQISDAHVMENGLRNNAVQVARRGIDMDFIKQLEELRNEVTKLNNEQEKLKADLKMKTAELDTTMREMNKLMRESRKVVKLEFPQEQWKEFGVNDKR